MLPFFIDKLILPTNYLEVVWQFRTSGITRIHSNSYKTVRIELKFCPFKNEHIQFLLNGSLDAKDLLCHHG